MHPMEKARIATNHFHESSGYRVDLSDARIVCWWWKLQKNQLTRWMLFVWTMYWDWVPLGINEEDLGPHPNRARNLFLQHKLYVFIYVSNGVLVEAVNM